MNEQRTSPPLGAHPRSPEDARSRQGANDPGGPLFPTLPDRLALVARALDSVSDGFCMLDRAARVLWLNRAMCELVAGPGLATEALLGKRLWDEVPGLQGSVAESRCLAALEANAACAFEIFFEPRQRWLELRAEPCPEGLSLWLRDITAARQRQHAADDEAARLRRALDAARLGEWQWEAARDCFRLDPGAAELVGLPAHQPLSWERLRGRILEPDQAGVRDAFVLATRQNTDLNIECRLLAPHDGQRWIAIMGRLDPQRACMHGVVQDIGPRKSAEDALRQSEEALRALANSIPQLAWMANADGYVVWYNERWYEYTGKSAADMLGWGWQTVQDPEVVPKMLERWRDSLRTARPFEMEFPIRGADGEFRWFLTRINPVLDQHGHVLRWFGTSTDVDQVKRVEQALRDESNVLEQLNATGGSLASQRELQSLLHTVADAATEIASARTGAVYYHAKGTRDMYVVCGTGCEHQGPFPPPRAAVLADRQLLRGEPLLIADLRADPRFSQTPSGLALPNAALPVRSYLAVPIMDQSGEMLATIFLGHPAPGMFDERVVRIVRGVAAQASVAIDNARLYEAAQRAADERKLLLENERVLRTEAERASQMKDEFLATLSHELRTPLSSILGWAQVLRRGSRDQADLNKGLQTIERNARAQAQLIEDLLDMSRITSGTVLLDMQSVAAPLFVDAAIETLRPAAEAKNIAVERQYAPSAGLIAGDPARLQQVIWNLLSNAIKFTPRDGRIEVQIVPVEGHVRIAVRDSGLGIRPEFLPHVFERFRQADASTTRRYGGLGLGLSIVKHLVEQHGGTVKVESEGEGKGATFSLELPLAKPHASATRGEREAPLPKSSRAAEMTLQDLSGVRVLVVDDEPDARELIKRVLSECDAQVTTAASAQEALELLRAAPPDVLVSDLGMPGMDGFELLAQVRALGPARGGNVPAVALTAFARSEDRVRALESGFWAHIAKPVEPSELIAAVATMARRPPP